ncbi:MAG TPA: hypothetical protein PL064_10460 [Thermogutta sp.]|nr:hypothetical protein [Thermogutta sp.]
MNARVRIYQGMVAFCLAFLILNCPALGQGVGQGTDNGPVANADQLRRQCDDLLARARQAIAEGNLNGAEQLLHQAEQLGVNYPPLYLGDTPAKVRKALESARQAQPAGQTMPQSPFDARGLGQTPDPKTQAKNYVRNGRMALARGNLSEAAQWCQMAAGLPATFAP